MIVAWLLGCVGGGETDSAADTDPPTACAPAPLPATPAWNSAADGYATGLGLGDFDGNGQIEVVIASGNDMAPGPVAVHPVEDGIPSLLPIWESDHVAYHGQLSVGDVDHDGYDDVVVSRYLGEGGFGTPGGVDLYRGGPGGLSGPTWSYEGVSTFANALGDLDLDGDLDLALAVGEAYQGDPQPQAVFDWEDGYGDAPTWTSGDAAYALGVAWADVDGDHDLDLVQARSGSGHAVYLGANGQLPSAPSWVLAGDRFDGLGVAFGDLTGDGEIELVFADNTFGGGPGKVSVWSYGAPSPMWTSSGSEEWSAVSVVDADGDGRLDVVTAGWWAPVTAWLADDDGLPSAPTSHTATEHVAEALVWRDLDGADEALAPLTGDRLVAVPPGARVVEISSPRTALGSGYLTAPGPIDAVIATSPRLDLLVSDWEPTSGTALYAREACAP